jgi:SAM-dependent methyltransferase
MALEFTELVRNFVPLGIGSDRDHALTENAMLGELVGSEKTVLEVALGGTLTDGLPSAGSSVTTIDPSQFDSPDAPLSAALGVTYDVVVLSDVLSYVRDPVRLLRQCRRLLNQGGFVVAALPNFGYGAIRLALLAGTYDEFAREQETNPRLHFFTLEVIESLLSRAGYRIEQTMRRSMAWDAALRESRYTALDEGIVNQIRRDPEQQTLTFVIKSVPIVHALPDVSTRDGGVEFKQQLDAAHAQLEEAVAENGQLRAAGRALRDQIAALRLRANAAGKLQGALDSALVELSGAFRVRDELLARLHGADSTFRELTKVKGQAEQARAELQHTLDSLKQQSEALHTRAEAAEKTALELASDLLQLTKVKDQAEQARAELQHTLDGLKQQNEALRKRAEDAEKTALELASDLLQATKTEVQQLSDLIDTVQRSSFWRAKHWLRGLRSLLIR